MQARVAFGLVSLDDNGKAKLAGNTVRVQPNHFLIVFTGESGTHEAAVVTTTAKSVSVKNMVEFVLSKFPQGKLSTARAILGSIGDLGKLVIAKDSVYKASGKSTVTFHQKSGRAQQPDISIPVVLSRPGFSTIEAPYEGKDPMEMGSILNVNHVVRLCRVADPGRQGDIGAQLLLLTGKRLLDVKRLRFPASVTRSRKSLPGAARRGPVGTRKKPGTPK